MMALATPFYALRDAFEHLGELVALDEHGLITYVSEGITNFLGYTLDDLEGRPLDVLHYRKVAPEFHRRLQEAINKGERWHGELIGLKKNGARCALFLTLTPSWNDGKLQGFLALYQSTDIPVYREVEDLLYRYRHGFNQALALAVVSDKGIVQEINEKFTELFGYTEEEIIGCPISVLKSGETSPKVYASLRETLVHHPVWTGEFIDRGKNGERIPVRATIARDARFHAKMHRYASYLAIYQDIRHEVAMREAQLALIAETIRQDMFAGALHNIGNIQQSINISNDKALTQAQSLATAIEEAKRFIESHPEEAQRFSLAALDICLNCARQIVEFEEEERKAIGEVNAILRYFREHYKREGQSSTVSEVNVQHFMFEIIDGFFPQMARHDISIAVGEIAPVKAHFNTERVRQILFNFLKNAKEAIQMRRQTTGAPKKGRIVFSSRLENDMIVFFVEDNGGGFDVPAERLFQQGFTTKSHGMGIGLHHCAMLASSLGGSITAENHVKQNERGARFSLRLPLKIAT